MIQPVDYAAQDTWSHSFHWLFFYLPSQIPNFPTTSPFSQSRIFKSTFKLVSTSNSLRNSVIDASNRSDALRTRRHLRRTSALADSKWMSIAKVVPVARSTEFPSHRRDDSPAFLVRDSGVESVPVEHLLCIVNFFRQSLRLSWELAAQAHCSKD